MVGVWHPPEKGIIEVSGDGKRAIWLFKRFSQMTIKARQDDTAYRLKANCYLIVTPRKIRSQGSIGIDGEDVIGNTVWGVGED